jgi:PAS domain S-box-containing protein
LCAARTVAIAPIAIGAWAPSFAHAQGVHSQEYVEEQGLPSVQVFGARQLDDGRMVFGSTVGIMTFDGREWVVDSGLKDIVPRVSHLALGSGGEIWVTHLLGGQPFAVRENGAWRRVNGPRLPSSEFDQVNFFEVAVRPGGDTLYYGVRQGIYALRDGQWTALATRDQLDAEIRGGALRGDELLLATRGGLVSCRDGILSRDLDDLLEPAGLARAPLLAVSVEVERDGSDRVWVLGSGWLGRIEAGAFELLTEDLGGLNVELPHELLADGGGGLLIGNGAGLWYYDATEGGVSRFRRNARYQAWPGVTDLFRDREGVLWITCARGVHRVPSLRFLNYSKVDGMVDDEVTAIVESPPGRMVFAHSEGLTFLQAGKLSTLALPVATNHLHKIISLAADASGNLWVARSRTGSMRIGVDGSVLHVPPTGEEFVSGVLVDDQQNVWLTSSRGLARWDGSAFVVPPENRALGNLRRVVQLSDGRLCALSYVRGALLRDGEGWRSIGGGSNPAVNNAYDAHLTLSGRLLVATEAGLMEVLMDGEGQGLRPYRERGFTMDRAVYSIAEDDRGVLWLGTQDGVVRWDGMRSTRLSTAEGLAGHETNREALFFDSRGRLWIGGVGGVSRYRPEFEILEAPAPRLEMRGVRVGRELRSAARNLSVGPSDNDLEFLFHGVTFAGDGHASYRFRLVGYDKDWTSDPEVSDGGHVRYTNLPSGDYRFEVAARNGDGAWSAPISSATIHVAAPFWRRWWFLAGAFSLLASIVWGINNLVHERRRSAQLDAAVRARTAKLLATERSYREVFEKSRAPQLLIDRASGRILAANDAAVEFYGMPAEDLIGAPFERFEAPSDELPRTDPCAVEVGRGQQLSSAQRVASGAIRHVDIFASAYELGGQQTVQAILQDVTEKQRLQSQLFVAQRMESIGLLAGGIAHDFNNILTIIMGNAELALAELEADGRTSDSLAHSMLQISESGERAARLTRQLLEFSRRQVVSFEIVDLNSIVRSMENMARRLTREDIRVVLELDEGLQPVMAEPSQMEQVILNLVVNAADAMPSGGTLTIRTDNIELVDARQSGRDASLAGRFIKLAVSDTGVGMDAVTRERVFEPFYSKKPMGRGTGLGLATIHGIVEQAGGTVEVESEPGRGSTFSVLLPATESVTKGTERGPDLRTPLHGIESILLCEDDESLRNLITRILSSHGYHILLAGLPSQALELAVDRSKTIDLLVTDVIMPESNGRELAEAVSELRPGLPVLFISGYTADVIAGHGVLDPGIEFLHKPFSALELLQRVRALVDRESPLTVVGPGR